MNILVLDLDGVVVRFRSPGRKLRPAVANETCVAALNRILQVSGAGIVVSSSWRQHTTVAKLQKCFKDWGIEGKVVGTTPVLFDRSKEILKWVEVNKDLIGDGAWVALDDDDLKVPNLIRCDPMVGLTEELASEAIVKLNGGEKLCE